MSASLARAVEQLIDAKEKRDATMVGAPERAAAERELSAAQSAYELVALMVCGDTRYRWE
ncbi:MAG: hypothetical protein WB495_09000 [Xanthobacteraceae bacterium]